MIAGFEASVSSGTPAATTAYAVLWAPTRRLRVREVGISNSSGTTALPQIQLFRVTARGTQTGTFTPTAAANAQDPADTVGPTALIDNAWSVQPTLATGLAARTVDIAGTVGSSWIFSWPADGEFVVPIGAGVAVWNGSGGSTAVARIYFTWGE